MFKLPVSVSWGSFVFGKRNLQNSHYRLKFNWTHDQGEPGRIWLQRELFISDFPLLWAIMIHIADELWITSSQSIFKLGTRNATKQLLGSASRAPLSSFGFVDNNPSFAGGFDHETTSLGQMAEADSITHRRYWYGWRCTIPWQHHWQWRHLARHPILQTCGFHHLIDHWGRGI